MSRPPEEASQHVLDAAERLFLEQGYAQAKLRDLAARLDMKTASLYYHAPGGKEELWHRVMNRMFKRHHDQLTQVAERAHPDLRSQLRAMADWLISQPSINPAFVASAPVNSEASVSMSERMYEGLMAPISKVVRQALERREIRSVEPDLVAGVFVTSIDGMVPLAQNDQLPASLQELAYQLVDILLDGILKK